MKVQQQPAAAQRGPSGLRGGHLLMLGVLAATAATVFVTRATGPVNTIAVAVAVATVGLAAAGLFRTLSPLVSSEAGEHTDMLAGRTRAALDREKMLVLRSIKEVEFDRAMRKISDADYQDMVGRLRVRAAGLIRQLDGHTGYRTLIERDLKALVGGPVAPDVTAPASAPPAPAPGTCPACGVKNDADARFCKACGGALEVSS
jgi:hypothetical protein